ncbi:hypothetical protein A2276_05300 [candidate division WOR-1 bacterium RIFOXYA12_FULL_43_27]|uniref:Uncharacterized protein n=1 Tax=candidate division WOR-1 bacterium RIFOXYC2_FULL_46_14 TaxID=1802587 RepID=A0A1F4U3U1_UNCSA|nr:MAG: hypothetical protein A2276_05300 [candidate division WOR-1 bacterium RIFOXYA12_FULL_43_27]OGC20082.1 MAG: hypothetical protein A2292_03305 [candidate division WOR-1 bacterium RIFOXYB2_FULL_46_45]OGC32182.1 MAG: hypothetical protein A2232_08145 [candidate division WOR-1 bacterium RIFOXYA2_FULL_46_56]OGC39582.1 MAG: hypothetical protein A2438_08510 [candidate division WOR-1 bacterium RIFOXYC2_FULL_46_14]
MTPAEATAEVFLTAFLNLRNREQDTFLAKLLKNKRLREDVIDLAIAEERNSEKTRPFEAVVSELRKSR